MAPLERVPQTNITPPASVKYTARDIELLYIEREDNILLEQLRAFEGTMKQFIDTQLMEKQKGHALNTQMFKHNLRGHNLNDYISEFEMNAQNRMHARSNGNVALHSIISFSPLDREKLTNEMIRDLVEKYISLRSPGAIFLGGLHTTEQHLHVHLLQSSIDTGTGLSNRISRTEFQGIKVALQEYQMEKYRDLESLPNHAKKTEERESSRKGYKENIFAADRSKAGNFMEVVRTTYARSISVSDFMEKMKALGHAPYFRDGRPQGIMANGRTKYRLSKLFNKQELKELDKKHELIERSKEELHDIRSRGRSLARGRISNFKEREAAKEREEEVPEVMRDQHEDDTTNEAQETDQVESPEDQVIQEDDIEAADSVNIDDDPDTEDGSSNEMLNT